MVTFTGEILNGKLHFCVQGFFLLMLLLDPRNGGSIKYPPPFYRFFGCPEFSSGTASRNFLIFLCEGRVSSNELGSDGTGYCEKNLTLGQKGQRNFQDL